MGKIFNILQTTLDSGRICGKAAMSPEEWSRNVPGHEEQIKALFLELVNEQDKMLLARYKDEDNDEIRAMNNMHDYARYHLEELRDKINKL